MLEKLILENWSIIDKLIVKDLVLQLIILLIFVVYLYWTIKDINIRLNKKINRPYYIDRFFYRFLKLQFIFVIAFLVNAFFVLGVLDHNIMECLITKFILSLGFFAWTSIIYSIELFFTGRYLEDYNNTQNVDNIWNWVKLGVTLVFFSLFFWVFVSDLVYLFY